MAVEEQLPGDLHEGIVDIEEQVCGVARAELRLDAGGEQLVVQTPPACFDLVPDGSPEGPVAIRAAQQRHQGVHFVLDSLKRDREMFITLDRPFFLRPALVGAELQPFLFTGDF